MTLKGGSLAEANGAKAVSNSQACSQVSINSCSAQDATEFKVYKRRWVMLALFCMTSVANAFHWVQYAIIVGVITKYYNVSPFTVDWLSMIYMLTYIVFLIPGEMLQKKGLRLIVLLASIGTTLGAWIKVGSLATDRFYVTFIGQSVIAVSQIFILGIPPRLAAVWFGPDQISTACSIGVFGNQFGIAAGFLIPPLIVADDTSTPDIENGLSIMFYSVAGFNTFLSLLVICFFRNEPPTPPSPARAAAIEENVPIKQSLLNLATNRSYVILLITYGLNVGVFYAVSTLLSQLVHPHFPHNDKDIGVIGLCIVLCGMVGSVVCGVWLDKTRKYRQTILAVYILSFLGMIAFALTLLVPHIAVVYVTASLLGFFMTGYLPLGFEFASEITYPEPESTSSGLLNVSANLFGIIFTTAGGQILEHFGDLATNMALSGSLFVGSVLTAFIKGDLRRQEAQRGVTNAPSVQVLATP